MQQVKGPVHSTLPSSLARGEGARVSAVRHSSPRLIAIRNAETPEDMLAAAPHASADFAVAFAPPPAFRTPLNKGQVVEKLIRSAFASRDEGKLQFGVAVSLAFPEVQWRDDYRARWEQPVASLKAMFAGVKNKLTGISRLFLLIEDAIGPRPDPADATQVNVVFRLGLEVPIDKLLRRHFILLLTVLQAQRPQALFGRPASAAGVTDTITHCLLTTLQQQPIAGIRVENLTQRFRHCYELGGAFLDPLRLPPDAPDAESAKCRCLIL